MCPFAGVGVNVGMEDALQLARQISSYRDDWKTGLATATKEYEQEMFARAEKNAAKTWEYTAVFFNPVGAEYMVQYFGNIKAKEEAATRDQAAGETKVAAEIKVAADVQA